MEGRDLQITRQNKRNHPTWRDQKNFFLNEDSLRNLWDNISQTNIHIVGGPYNEGEERKKEAENLSEDKNFPNLGQDPNIPVQEAQCLKQDEPKEFHTEIRWN